MIVEIVGRILGLITKFRTTLISNIQHLSLIVIKRFYLTFKYLCHRSLGDKIRNGKSKNGKYIYCIIN